MSGSVKRFGRYELGAELGRGGSGRVYRAELVGAGGFRKPVALKLLHRGGAMLRREARIGGLLRHRNLVDVYEIGEVDGSWFCAMELCEMSLSDALPLPPRAVVEVGIQVCRALGYAHGELGLVHQDIKPANLLVSADGTVKVADLGIARAEGFELQGIRGTRGYVAPEQARGAPVDARADVYSLGVTLTELATGSRPTASVTLSLTESNPPKTSSETLDLASLGDDESGLVHVPPPGVPDWLAPIVGRCLEADREERWPSMSELAEALSELQPEGEGLVSALGLGEREGGPDDAHELSVSAMVGRQSELQELARALEMPGHIQLNGPPGIGKSRLAVEAGRRWGTAARAQVYRCDLAGVSTLDGLCILVARTLRVPIRGQDTAALVGRAIAGRGPVVLLLDNADRLQSQAEVFDSWAGAAPEARIVSTSRAGLPGVRAVKVGPLDVDSSTRLLALRAMDRGVNISDDPWVAELAERLDGLPLALELAAGRVGVLSVRDVLERLDLSLLSAGTTHRHGTLRAALDWSWSLLDPIEKQALAQLSVFEGGFTYAAAEQVLELERGTAFEAITSLIECSMVVGGPRPRLLSSVQAHAREQLVDAEAVETRHGRWCGRLQASLAHRGPAHVRSLIEEAENLIVACHRAIARGEGRLAADILSGAFAALAFSSSPAPVIELARAIRSLELDPLVEARVRLTQARASWAVGEVDASTELFEDLLRGDPDPWVEGQVYRSYAGLLRQLGQVQRAFELYDKALALLEPRATRADIASTLTNQGVAMMHSGKHVEAAECFERARRIIVEIGHAERQGDLLHNRGLLWSYRGRADLALVDYLEALEQSRRMGDRRSEAEILGNLGVLYRSEGRLEEARKTYEQALELHRQCGNTRSVGMVLGNLGNVHRIAGDNEAASRYWEEALMTHRSTGNRGSEVVVLGNMAKLRETVGDLDGALRDTTAAVVLAREVGQGRVLGWMLTRQAQGSFLLGDLSAAESALDEGESILRRVGDPVLVCVALALRVELLVARGARADAQRVLAEIERVIPPRQVDAEEALQRARSALTSRSSR